METEEAIQIMRNTVAKLDERETKALAKLMADAKTYSILH